MRDKILLGLAIALSGYSSIACGMNEQDAAFKGFDCSRTSLVRQAQRAATPGTLKPWESVVFTDEDGSIIELVPIVTSGTGNSCGFRSIISERGLLYVLNEEGGDLSRKRLIVLLSNEIKKNNEDIKKLISFQLKTYMNLNIFERDFSPRDRDILLKIKAKGNKIAEDIVSGLKAEEVAVLKQAEVMFRKSDKKNSSAITPITSYELFCRKSNAIESRFDKIRSDLKTLVMKGAADLLETIMPEPDGFQFLQEHDFTILKSFIKDCYGISELRLSAVADETSSFNTAALALTKVKGILHSAGISDEEIANEDDETIKRRLIVYTMHPEQSKEFLNAHIGQFHPDVQAGINQMNLLAARLEAFEGLIYQNNQLLTMFIEEWVGRSNGMMEVPDTGLGVVSAIAHMQGSSLRIVGKSDDLGNRFARGKIVCSYNHPNPRNETIYMLFGGIHFERAYPKNSLVSNLKSGLNSLGVHIPEESASLSEDEVISSSSSSSSSVTVGSDAYFSDLNPEERAARLIAELKNRDATIAAVKKANAGLKAELASVRSAAEMQVEEVSRIGAGLVLESRLSERRRLGERMRYEDLLENIMSDHQKEIDGLRRKIAELQAALSDKSADSQKAELHESSDNSLAGAGLSEEEDEETLLARAIAMSLENSEEIEK